MNCLLSAAEIVVSGVKNSALELESIGGGDE
jgi:hypothetical protein